MKHRLVHFMLRHKTHLLLLLLLLTAGFFRFYNLNWDQGNFFHPDERNIDNAVANIRFFSQLNPGFFAYGGFSIYLYRAAGEFLVFVTKDSQWVTNWTDINLIGRFFSAFFSTMTIVPLYFLSKRIGSARIALLTIVLYTFMASSIQMAHFGVTESLFTFTGVLLCWLSLQLLTQPTLRRYLVLGGILGIAGATKTTELGFFLFILTAHIVSLLKLKTARLQRNKWLLLSVLAGGSTFILCSPYTFLAWNKFVESMHYESGVATGSLAVPYTLQFNGTPPYLFQLSNFFWQLGPIAIVAILGSGWLLYLLTKTKRPDLLVFFSFPLMYFLYAGAWHTKFIRYMVPILPFLLICAAYLLVTIAKKWKRVGKLLIGLFLAVTILWALAFFSIYIRPQTRITASEWIYQHIPAGSQLYTEHWDDGLPISVGQYSSSQYPSEPLTIYDPDTDAKLIYYSEKLATGEYIVINSRRLYGTLMRLTNEYPLTSSYYRLLFDGQLGYTQIKQFTSYPQLFGLTINDDASEETFQVYDHPKVLIFKNSEHLNQATLRAILQTGWEQHK